MNPYAEKLAGRDPLAVAAATPAKIVTLIRGLRPRQLAKTPAPGKWSIQEIIRHLADTEMVMCCRSRWIAFEEQPALVPFDQDRWAAGATREKEPLAETLERFRTLRRSQLRLFHAAPKQDLARTGHHPERGVVSLQEQLETFAGHDLNHLEQIQRLAGEWKAGR
ncbi:MAG TPA: DinB family protein [Candidatus Sulfotelmatobacter sp.]|nr:DinB family protein [Candidatus Sulfotelmatobacter sp.]